MLSNTDGLICYFLNQYEAAFLQKDQLIFSFQCWFNENKKMESWHRKVTYSVGYEKAFGRGWQLYCTPTINKKFLENLKLRHLFVGIELPLWVHAFVIPTITAKQVTFLKEDTPTQINGHHALLKINASRSSYH